MIGRINLVLLTSLLFVVICVFSQPAEAAYRPGQEQPKPFIIKGIASVQLEDDVDVNVARRGFGKVSFGLATLDKVLNDHQVEDFKAIFPWRKEKPKTNSGMKDLTRWVEISFPETVNVNDVVNALKQNPHVRFAEPVWAMPMRATPDDPQWSSQWAMEPPGPDPDFYTAWDMETGSDSIKYGAIDSGVNWGHDDLEGNIWVNPGEDMDGDGVVYDTDDLNGIDDDGNGVVDDLIGYDFFSGLGGGVWPGEDAGGPDSDPDDHNGHGTHIAGIGAAMTNNGINVTGAAGGWYGGHRSMRGVQIMCLRIGATGADGNGYVNANNAATAIDYAILMGVDVINASWGGAAPSAAAASNAIIAGVTFCHAAGNENNEVSDDIDAIPGVLSVASLGPFGDARSSFSNYGFWVDLSAPGSDVLSTYSNAYVPTTASLYGTSMASPMVAGLSLLIRSAMPSLTGAQVDSLMLVTADPVEYANAAQYHFKLGSGRINANTALSALANAKFTAPITDGNVPLDVQFTDQSPNSPTSWDWSFGTGDVSTVQNPLYTYTTPGVYDVSLIIDDGNALGLGEEHLRDYVWARADSLIMDSVEVSSSTKDTIPIYLKNTALVREITFAFQLENHNNTVTYDGFSVEGLRTEYFASVDLINENHSIQKFIIRMRPDASSATSNYLTPDTGAILNLIINIGPGAIGGQLVTIDTVSGWTKVPVMQTPYGSYWPEFTPGKLLVTLCGHGDANCDGDVFVDDLSMIVAYLFTGGPAPDARGGNVDGIGFPEINVNDITYLVAYLFKGGPPPPL